LYTDDAAILTAKIIETIKNPGGSLGDLTSANRYVYANDDPVNAVDPSGKAANFILCVNWYCWLAHPNFPFSRYGFSSSAEDYREAILFMLLCSPHHCWGSNNK
jgi:hypothetical protein